MLQLDQITRQMGSGSSWLTATYPGMHKIEKAQQIRQQVLDHINRLEHRVTKETLAQHMEIKVGLAHTILCQLATSEKIQRELVKRGATRVAYFSKLKRKGDHE